MKKNRNLVISLIMFWTTESWYIFHFPRDVT